MTNAEEFEKKHTRPSRSLSRPARGAEKRDAGGDGGRRRRYSGSYDDSEVIKRVEQDFRPYEPPPAGSKKIFDRLAANVYKYQHLHKVGQSLLVWAIVFGGLEGSSNGGCSRDYSLMDQLSPGDTCLSQLDPHHLTDVYPSLAWPKGAEALLSVSCQCPDPF